MTDIQSEKAKYKQENNFARKMLEVLIPQYNKSLQIDMIQECGAIMKNIRRFSSKTSSKDFTTLVNSWTIKGANGEPAYFTMDFTLPIIQYIPSAFKPIHFKFNFTIYNQVEYVPCYMMNLNHVTLVKITQNFNSDIYNNLDKSIFAKYVYEGGRSMNFSSSNILLLGATKEHVQASKHDIIEKCFEYCYWHLPTPKNMNDVSCLHNLIYHKSKYIVNGGVLQLRKTILKIIKINGKSMLKILPSGSSIKCKSVFVSILVDDGKKIFSEKRHMFITENIINSLKNNDIIHAIIITQNICHPKFSLIIGKIGNIIDLSNLKPFLSIIFWKHLQDITENSSITKVGHLKNITEYTSKILQDNSNEDDLFYPLFIWNTKLSKNIEKSILELFPLYIFDDDIIHQLSPTMLSFLLTISPEIVSDKKFINTIIHLLDHLNINSNNWGKNSTSILDSKNNVVTPSLNTILSNLPKIVNRMTYSRIFSKHYTCWN